MADAQGKFVSAEPLFEELPKGWIRTTLDRVAVWSSGGTPSRKQPAYFDGSIPWAKIGDLDDATLQVTEESITEEGLASSSAKVVPAGTLLLAMYGASIGKLGIAGIPCATNQAIACGQVHPEVSSAAYVFKYLQYSRHRLVELGQGGAQPNVSQAIVKLFPVLIPPLAEQRRIVSRIDELFSRIEAGERAIAAARKGLKRYRKSILKAAVTGALTADWREERGEPEETGAELLARVLDKKNGVQPGTASGANGDDLPSLPSDWTWATIDQLTTHFANGLSRRPADLPTDFPILRISAVRAMSVDAEDTRNYQPEPREELSRYWVQKGDLLFTRYNGSAELVGVCGLYRSDEPKLHPDKLMRAVPCRIDGLRGDWLEIAANAGRTAKFIAENVKTSAGQHGIAGSDVKRAPVPLPPADEQAEIVSRVEAALSRIGHAETTLNAQERNARALKRSILKAAFQGRLVSQDSNDEPASDMLARLNTELRGTA